MKNTNCECSELGRMLDIHNVHCPRFEEQETARLASVEKFLDQMTLPAPPPGSIRVPMGNGADSTQTHQGGNAMSIDRLDTTKQATEDDLLGWYTKEQLEAAFNKVQNPNHWKNPIDAYCHKDEVDVVREAIEFFTATVPTFWNVGMTDIRRVEAPGYYLGPAGP